MPIFVTPSGIVISVRLEHLKNALSSISSNVGGNVTSSSVLLKAPIPILVTVYDLPLPSEIELSMVSCLGFPDVPETVTDSPSALTVYLRFLSVNLIGAAATAPMGRNVNVMLSATNRLTNRFFMDFPAFMDWCRRKTT